jgi:hypothetical protein
MHRRVLSLLLLTCLGPSAASSGTTDSPYSEAARAFMAQPIPARYELQMLLAAAGYSVAVSTDDFNSRIYEAITRFQAGSGLPVTGVVSASPLATLHAQADPVLNYWGLKEFNHPSARGRLWVPAAVVNATQTTPDLQFDDQVQSVRIYFKYLPGLDLQTVYKGVLEVRAANQVTINYKAINSDFFVVSGGKRVVTVPICATKTWRTVSLVFLFFGMELTRTYTVIAL